MEYTPEPEARGEPLGSSSSRSASAPTHDGQAEPWGCKVWPLPLKELHQDMKLPHALDSRQLRAPWTEEGRIYLHERCYVRVHMLVARAVGGRAGPGHIQVAAPLLGHALRQRRQLGRRAAAQALACTETHCLGLSPSLYTDRSREERWLT